MSYQNPNESLKTSDDDTRSVPALDWTEERLAALRLSSIWQLGSRALQRIEQRYDSPIDVFHSNADEWRDIGCTDVQVRALIDGQARDITELAQTLDSSAIRFVQPTDLGYPVSLLRTADPPFALFIRGAPLADELRLAVVGTRRMTDYGKRATELIVGECTRSRMTIVSGLALGVDAAAHQACLNEGGTTLAVLPSGIDDRSVAPQTNLPLARRILDAGGTLISELAPGTPTFPYQFLHRNRLIAWLSDATVVVEADRDSGALVTAKLALEEGREVLAVPGSIWSASSRGTNDLIKNGARPCTGAEDVFAALGFSNPDRARQINEARSTLPTTPEEQTVLDGLDEPQAIDDLARKIKMTVAKTNAVVSMLELKGRVISVGTRTFVKNV